MTALEVSIEETYKQVFGDNLQENDYPRIGFLESVVSGTVECDGKMVTIVDALKKEEEALKKAKKKDERTAHAKQIKDYEAIHAMQEWYLHSEKIPMREVRAEMLRKLGEAEMHYVVDTLDDCMMVLQKHRITSLLGTLDKAFALETKYRESAIHATTETLLKSGNRELQEKVMDKMAAYHSSLKQTLDEELQHGSTNSVYNIARRLVDSGVKSLQQYAISGLESSGNEYFRQLSAGMQDYLKT